MSWLRRYIVDITVFCFALIIANLLVPKTLLHKASKIPASDISIVGDDINIIPNRLVANANIRPLRDQFREKQTGSRRFHFKFDENWPVAGARALYIPSTSSEARIFVNGAPLGMSKNKNISAPALGREWVHLEIPRWILVPGVNRVDIHFDNNMTGAGLRSVFIGPSQSVDKIAQRHKLWNKILPAIAIVASCLCFPLVILGALYGRRRILYLFLGVLAAITSGFPIVSYLNGQSGFAGSNTGLMSGFCVAILVALAVYARTDTGKWSHLKVAKYPLILLAALGPLLSLAILWLNLSVSGPMWIATLCLLGCFPLIYARGVPMLFSDVLAHRSKLEELRSTVSLQAEELDEKGQIIAKEMRNRAVLEERQRFTRDIHDGIGGQLLSLLLQLRSGDVKKDQIENEIQTGLNDLRLVVDSMDHTGDDLTAALTTFQARAAAQMRAAGIDFQWIQPRDPQIKHRSGRGILNIYRFLQEAITNIVRHADAKSVVISIIQEEAFGELSITVEDDGIGIEDIENIKAGKGVANMKARALAMNAALTFGKNQQDTGTSIRLEIPASI